MRCHVDMYRFLRIRYLLTHYNMFTYAHAYTYTYIYIHIHTCTYMHIHWDTLCIDSHIDISSLCRFLIVGARIGPHLYYFHYRLDFDSLYATGPAVSTLLKCFGCVRFRH